MSPWETTDKRGFEFCDILLFTRHRYNPEASVPVRIGVTYCTRAKEERFPSVVRRLGKAEGNQTTLQRAPPVESSALGAGIVAVHYATSCVG